MPALTSSKSVLRRQAELVTEFRTLRETFVDRWSSISSAVLNRIRLEKAAKGKGKTYEEREGGGGRGGGGKR